MVILSINLFTSNSATKLMTSKHKGHSKGRPVSPLFFQTGSIQYPRYTPYFTSENTSRKNQVFNRLEDKAYQIYTLANKPTQQLKTSYLKYKEAEKNYSINRNQSMSNKPEISITFGYDSFPKQDTLKQGQQTFPSYKNTTGSIQMKSNTAQIRSFNPQKFSIATPKLINSHQSPFFNQSSETKKSKEEKQKQWEKGRFSINKTQNRKQKSSSSKNIKQEKKMKGRINKIEDIFRKNNNIFQKQENLEQSESKSKQSDVSKYFEGLLEQKNKKILTLEQKVHSLTKQNKKLRQDNFKLQEERQVYSQLKKSNNQQFSKYGQQQMQQEAISNKMKLSILNLLSKKLANKESQLQEQTQKNKQLQAIIANLKEGKKRQSSAFKNEYVQLLDRLRERESVIQQLQMSNNVLREQYAQLHINIQRISKEKQRCKGLEQEQQSFIKQQNGKFIVSSIR